MKLPRDISGKELAKALEKLGYEQVRQKGSHLYLKETHGQEHHVAVPLHDPLKIGTLAGILSDVAAHFGISRAELLERMFR